MSPFTGKDWRNATTHEGGGDETTPLSAAAIEDLETRVTDYASLLAGPAAGIYNVLDYGAVGDGATDDAAAIQAAFDAVPAGGGVVYFPPCASGYAVEMGDYSVITVPNNTTVLGSGYAGRIVRTDTFSVDTYSWLFTNEATNGTAANITFKDLWIEGNYAAVPGSTLASNYRYGAIRIEDYNAEYIYRIRVEGCTIVDWPGDAITLRNVKQFVVEGNMVDGATRGAFAGYGENAYGVVVGNQFYNSFDDNIAVNGNPDNLDVVATHIAIVGNETRNQDAAFFGLVGGGNCGIGIRAAEDIVVSGNLVYNAEAQGILVCDQYDKMSKRVIIADNQITDPTGNGIRLGAGVGGGNTGTGAEAGESYVISGNTILNPTENGMRIDPVSSTADLTDITITNNEIREAGGAAHGILITESAQTGGAGEIKRVVISGNRVHRSGNCSIFTNALTLEDLVIDGNVCTQSGITTAATGSLTVDGTVSDFRVSNNLVSDNTGATALRGIVIGSSCTSGMVFDNQSLTAHFSGTGLLNSADTTVEFRGNKTKTTMHTVASGATVTLPVDAPVVEVTGTTSITSVTASWPGRIVTLMFSDANPGTFTDGSNLKLAGNFDPDPDDTITLFCNGTNWYEMGRSVN